MYWFSFVFCVIGAFIIRLGYVDDGFFISPIHGNENAKIDGLLITVISFLFFFLTIWFVEILNGRFEKRGRKSLFVNWNRFVYRPVEISSQKTYYLMFFLTIIFCAYYIYSISPAPFMMAISGSSPTEVAIRRIAVTKDYEGVGYFKTIAQFLPVILCYYQVFRLHNNSTSKLIVFGSFVFSSFILIVNGEKAPLIFFIIGFILCISVYRPLSRKILIYFTLMIFSFLVFLYILLFQFNDVDYLLKIIIERVFVAQEAAVFYAADYFSNANYLGFSTLDNLITKVFGLVAEPRASELFMYKYLPDMVANGGWNVNGYFGHESYSNFGWIGVFIGSIWGGATNSLLCIYLRATRKTEITMAFYVFFSISVTTLLSSFNLMLFNTQLILVFMFFIFFKCLDSFYTNVRS